MTICFFGTYDRPYSRNSSLLSGLMSVGIVIKEVHLQLKQTALNSADHIGISEILRRVWQKCLFLPLVAKHISDIRSCDVMFCAYPGHLDLPLAWMIAKLFRKPLVFDPLFSLTDVFLHDFGIMNKTSIKAKILYAIEWVLFRLPDLVLADTPYQKKNYHALFGIPLDRIAVVPLSADTKKYTKKTSPPENKKIRVIYYGLYNPIHGVEHIIEAARILSSEKHIEFLMIGDGQTYPDAVKMANTHALENVHFYTHNEEQALPLLYTGDIFLGLFGKSYTAWRTIPNKVLQGMAMGIPTITGEGAGISSFFEHKKHAMIIPQEDPKALAASILTLAQDPALRGRMAETADEVFQKHFTPEAVAETCKEALEKMIP